MRLAVVCVGERMGILVPISRVVRDIGAQRSQYRAVVTFHLAVCLRVISGCEVVLDGQYAAYVQEVLACEAGSVVRDEFLWGP